MTKIYVHVLAITREVLGKLSINHLKNSKMFENFFGDICACGIDFSTRIYKKNKVSRPCFEDKLKSMRNLLENKVNKDWFVVDTCIGVT